MANEKLVLIDGHALAYRVFFGLPIESFTTKSGEPTNATFGFTRTLLDLILSEDPPQYLAVSFDVGKTFRDEMFAEYKGTREKMPDELSLQIDRIKQIVRALNIPILELDGYEADDVLGTMARQAKEKGVPVHIITGDRDLLQLVDDNTIVELPPGSKYQREPQVFDVAAFIKKYEINPPQLIDYKALTGDKSDNIPGITGIGDKTATKLLLAYHTLDGIYENIEEAAKGKMKERLVEGKEDAYLSYKLAKIVTDAPIKLNLEACVTHEFDLGPVLDLFREVEFRTLTRRLTEGAQAADLEAEEDEALAFSPEDFDFDTADTTVILVQDQKALDALVKTLQTAKEVAFDVETTGLDKLTADLVGISLSVKKGEAYYIPVGHVAEKGQATSGQMELFNQKDRQLAPHQLGLTEVLNALRPALTNPNLGKIAHNAKFDYAILDQHGLTVTPITFDSLIGEWLTNPGSKQLGLKDLAYDRLGIAMTEITELIGKGKEQITFDQVPIADAAPYAAADADMTLRLTQAIRKEVKEKKLGKIFEIEMPLIAVLADMEKAGIGVDVSLFDEISARLDEQIQTLTEEIQAIAGRPFNLNSTYELSDVLFIELNISHERTRKLKKKRDDGGSYFSTAADVLEGIEPLDETGIVSKMMEYREVQKLKSTYVDSLPTMVNEETGRIHTTFDQTGAETGRIASKNPNLQNIPIRTAAGREIRKGFVAKPGHLFIAADYSQVELRVLAHMSQDEGLIKAFREGQDIHRATAAAVYGINMDAVTFEQRRFAKSVNFGLIYGMGAFRLSRDSELTLAESREFIETYFERFPGIKNFLDGYKEQAKKQGYVETLLGRRRYFPIFKEIGRTNEKLRAEREAINHPIQGTAADIIKIAMIRLHKLLEENYQTKMILQIHDELMFEAPEAEVDEVKALVVKTMSEAIELDVPLKVDANVGRTWYEVKD